MGALVGVLAAVLCAGLPGTAAAQFAAPDRPGPELSPPARGLDSALLCSGGIDGASRAPVLLVHGTSISRDENWSAGYLPALTHLGIPWCAIALPDRATGDIQVHAEYVAYAIRQVHRRAGRRISIIGASQGGMLPRWAMRFWPDTRAMVDDLIGLGASNHGTTRGELPCRSGCRPAHWQQRSGSRFIRALNSFAETFRGVSYSNVYTRFDEVVTPPESAELHGGDGRITNVAVQDICPLDFSDHVTLVLANATAFALALDALNRDGPASVAAVGARGCGQPRIPGYDPARTASLTVSYLAHSDEGVASVRAEPPLRCYVTASCPAAATRAAGLRLSLRPRHVRRGRLVRLRVQVRARLGGRLAPVRGAVVATGGRRVRTNRRGRGVLPVRFSRPGRRRVVARARGYAPTRATIRVLTHRAPAR